MADLILKVTSEEVRNKAQEISTQRELLEGYMQEMQNQVTSLESSFEKKLRKYFPSDYTEEDMRSVIVELLEQWSQGKEQD